MRYTAFLTLTYLAVSIGFSQSTASKQVSTFTIVSKELNNDRKIWLYLPNGYETTKKSYPVIYMHDAQNLFDAKTSFVGEWKVDEFLDTLNTKESIIVGIEHGNDRRISELTPYKNDKYGGGEGNSYLDFIKNTLKPYIDSNYRTITSAEHTSLFGASLGGLISFYGVVKHPDIFGKAGVFSPSFWINPEVYALIANSKISSDIKLYFLVGTKEGDSMVEDMKRMIDLLKSIDREHIQIKDKIIEGGEHNEAFWSKYFSDAYLWLYN